MFQDGDGEDARVENRVRRAVQSTQGLRRDAEFSCQYAVEDVGAESDSQDDAVPAGFDVEAVHDEQHGRQQDSESYQAPWNSEDHNAVIPEIPALGPG